MLDSVRIRVKECLPSSVFALIGGYNDDIRVPFLLSFVLLASIPVSVLGSVRICVKFDSSLFLCSVRNDVSNSSTSLPALRRLLIQYKELNQAVPTGTYETFPICIFADRFSLSD